MKAAVFVDVQNDFVKGGKLAFGYPVEDNVPKVIEFAKECAAAGCKIYVTRDTHEATVRRDTGGMSGYLATLEGRRLPVEHCVEGTDGWQVVDGLADVLVGKATFVNKPTFGSLDLADIMEEDGGFDEITVCGYDLSICVAANAVLLRAKFPDARITVRTDLCGDVDKEAFDAAVKVLRMQQIDVEGIH